MIMTMRVKKSLMNHY